MWNQLQEERMLPASATASQPQASHRCLPLQYLTVRVWSPFGTGS